MRYPASEKLEVIRLVEGSHLSARKTLAKLGIPRTTFYRWYDRYLTRGEAGLTDQSPKPKHVWNRIPDDIRRKVVNLALKETELSPRELAVTFTDTKKYFISEASVYRVLKAHGYRANSPDVSPTQIAPGTPIEGLGASSFENEISGRCRIRRSKKSVAALTTHPKDASVGKPRLRSFVKR